MDGEPGGQPLRAIQVNNRQLRDIITDAWAAIHALNDAKAPDGAQQPFQQPRRRTTQLPVPAAVQARSRTHLSTIEGVCEPARPRQRLPGVLNLQVAVDLRGGGYRGVAEQLAHHLHRGPGAQ